MPNAQLILRITHFELRIKMKLASFSILQLTSLYRRAATASDDLIAAGREHATCYRQGRIVAELRRRTPADEAERRAIAECETDYRRSLARLSGATGLPIGPIDQVEVDGDTPAELCAAIDRLSGYTDLAGREALIATVDHAIDLLDRARQTGAIQPVASLAATVAELGRKGEVRCPAWVMTLLADAVAQWLARPAVPDTNMVLPLLTQALYSGDWTLQRRAARIIRRHRLPAYPDYSTHGAYGPATS